MATVALVGTLDTKGEEYAYLRDRVQRAGSAVLMINAGVMGDPDYRIDFTRADVAAAAGSSLEELAAVGRGAAVGIQARGAAAIVRRLFADGQIDGIMGMGGSGGSSLISLAMRELPVGVPKLLVSTMASGDVSPYVDISDVTMMYSVIDVAGINRLSARILSNAAAAISGWRVATRHINTSIVVVPWSVQPCTGLLHPVSTWPGNGWRTTGTRCSYFTQPGRAVDQWRRSWRVATSPPFSMSRRQS